MRGQAASSSSPQPVAETASPTAARSLRSRWSPSTSTTVRPVRPRPACRTSRAGPARPAPGTATASSSGARDGRPRGGSSGKARQSTPAAPVAAAVRQATRPPEERPPVITGRPVQRPGAQLLEHARPRDVEPRGRRRRAPARDAIRLLHERDRDLRRTRRRARRREVGRADRAGRAVAEHERRARALDRLQVRARVPCGVSSSSTVSGIGAVCQPAAHHAARGAMMRAHGAHLRHGPPQPRHGLDRLGHRLRGADGAARHPQRVRARPARRGQRADALGARAQPACRSPSCSSTSGCACAT